MTIDNGVAISLATVIGGIGVWALDRFSKLEIRMEAQEVSHEALKQSFNELKDDIKDKLAAMSQSQRDFLDEFRSETRYIKGRLDGMAARLGTGPLRRNNDDDRLNRHEDA